MLQNELQPTILDKLYQIMFKIIILSQIGADRYQKHIFEIILLSPLENCAGQETGLGNRGRVQIDPKRLEGSLMLI